MLCIDGTNCNMYIVTAELQTASVAYFQRKIQLSVFYAYPDGRPSQLIWISGVILYSVMIKNKFIRKTDLSNVQ